MDDRLQVLGGDALERLRELEDESVHCCVTSPPYWGLRDYGTAAWEGGDEGCDHKSGRFERGGLSSKQASNNGSGGDEATSDCPKCGARRIDSQLGLERTPEEYVAKLVEVFREVRRVLRKDGTLWLNLGSTYAGGGNYRGTDESTLTDKQRSNRGAHGELAIGRKGTLPPSLDVPGFKPKDLVPIPWMVAMALQADGWWLRQDIIWSKPGPMPESVTDRFCKSHEYIFLLTKSAHYFFDQEAVKEKGSGRCPGNVNYKYDGLDGYETKQGILAQSQIPQTTRIKRSVWTINTAPYAEAHFATYPPDLVKPCIMAGTSAKGCCARCGAPWERVVERSGGTIGNSWHDHNNDLGVGQRCTDPRGKGCIGRSGEEPYKVETLGWQPGCKCNLPFSDPCTVLDPFAGSGTTGAVALELGRRAVLIELNPEYLELIRQRCSVTVGLALA